jgi:hypothetical protein
MTYARRVQAIRARCRVLRWEYRQRNLAHGAWAKFSEALALASEAYAIDEVTMTELVAEGFVIDDRGSGLEPPRRIVWLTRHRATALRNARSLVLQLDARMLETRTLALVAFATP